MIPDWLLYPGFALGAAVWLACLVGVVALAVDEFRGWRADRREPLDAIDAGEGWARFADPVDDVWSERAA